MRYFDADRFSLEVKVFLCGVFFILGTLTADLVGAVLEQFEIVFFTLFLVSFLLMFVNVLGGGKKTSLAFLSFFFLLGLLNYLLVFKSPAEDLSKLLGDETSRVLISGTVTNMPRVSIFEDGDRRISFIFKLDRIKTSKEEESVFRSILVNSTDEELKVSPGMRLVLGGRLIIPDGPSNPGGFDMKRHLQLQNLSAILRHTGSDHKLVLKSDNGLFLLFLRKLYFVRARTDKVLEKNLREEAYFFARAILLGKRGLLKEADKTLFQKTGTAHMIAVSGLHVGIAGGLLLFLLKLSRFPDKSVYLTSIVFMMSFAFLTGGRASSLRAASMFSIVLASRFFKFKIAPYTVISLSALLILFFTPGGLFTAGFILSYMAVISIISINPVMDGIFQRYITRLPEIRFVTRFLKSATKAFSVSFSVWIGLLPVLAHYFGGISFIALLANLAAVPAVFVLISTGAGVLITAWQGSLRPMTFLFSFIFELFYDLLKFVLSFLEEAPYAWVETSRITLGFIFIYYLLLFCALYFLRRKKKSFFVSAVFILSVANLFVWCAFRQIRPAEDRFVFFDTGKADAILIERPSGAVFLIDGASRRRGHGKRVLGEYFRKRGIKKIDWIFLSHPHEDHIGGLFHILENYSVGKVIAGGIMPACPESRRLYLEFKELLREKDVSYHTVAEGDLIKAPRGKKIYILNPSVRRSYKNINNASMVFRLENSRKGSFLFCGDAEEKAVKDLLRYPVLLDTDILKIPHHGQKIASEVVFELFLDETGPREAIILNSYSRALNEELMESLKEKSVEVHITGRDGASIN